jgi:hypothetical protein
MRAALLSQNLCILLIQFASNYMFRMTLTILTYLLTYSMEQSPS